MSTSANAGVTVSRLNGRAGFARVAACGRFTAPDTDRYEACWRHVSIDGIQIAEWTTSPIAGSRLVADRTAVAVLLKVAEGSFRYWVDDDAAADASVGSVLLLAAGDQVRFAVPAATRLLRVVVPTAVLPHEVRRTAVRSAGQVTPSALTSSLFALVETVLDTGGEASPAARAIRPLLVATLEELVPRPTAADQRGRILEYIDRHITEPELDPQSIADAFGISLRWVHHHFNQDGDSLARHIRLRRIDLIAAQLRTDHRFPRIGALAARNGFTSRDQMTRAFKARYGMPIADYAEQVSRGNPPTPVAATQAPATPEDLPPAAKQA